MKKSIALVALAFGVTSAFAQDLTSKKGEPILPEAEDWSIGVDATPFLNYVGNFFGKAGAASGVGSNQAPNWNFLTSGLMITGKKFKDAQNAMRASVRLGYINNVDKRQVVDIKEQFPVPTVYPGVKGQEYDVAKTSTTNISLSVGMEKRKGKTRLQGYYGADFGVGITSSKESYTYVNPLSLTDGTTPEIGVGTVAGNVTSTNFGSNITSDIYGNAARVTSRKPGMGFVVGVRGFIGCEYFILPKISLGAEFGWGIGFSLLGKDKLVTESIGTDGSGARAIGTIETTTGRGHSFWFDTDHNNAMWGSPGSLKLQFYF